MNTPKIIALDIETSNLDLKSNNIFFNNPKGWEISCVCVYNSYEDKLYSFVKNPKLIKSNYQHLIKNPFNEEILDEFHNFEMLKVFLEKWFIQGYTLLTHNGMSFDMPILCKKINKGGGDVKDIYRKYTDSGRHIDTCNYLLKHTGFRFNLQNLINGVLGPQYNKLMKASFAPKEWANGNYLQVLLYCIGDVVYTYKVYDGIIDNGGSFKALVKHNKKEFTQEVNGVAW
jgi:DNA polymerase elongation subunit (family B)